MNLIKRLVIIPARLKSTRFKEKLLTKIYGKSLLEYTYKNALKATLPEKVIVACDNQKLFDLCTNMNANVIMTSKDCKNGTYRVNQAINTLDNISDDAIVINVQGDEPCLDPKVIDELIEVMESDPSINMATLVSPFKNLVEASEPSCVKCVFDQDHNAMYFSRSLIPHCKDVKNIHLHIGVYAYRKSFLKIYSELKSTPLQLAEDCEQLKVLENGYKIKVIITDHISMGVDVPEDIKKVEPYLCP